MSELSPVGCFNLIDDENKLMKLDLSKYNDVILKGCILEVDFEYPNEMHSFTMIIF